MTGAPIVLAVAAAALAALSLRFDGIAATLVAGYLALVAQLGAVTWLLSPFAAVTPGWLTAVEGVLALAAAARGPLPGGVSSGLRRLGPAYAFSASAHWSATASKSANRSSNPGRSAGL